jgi:hypothetical protein
LNQTPEAIRYLEDGHARGKVVITTETNETAPMSANRAANSVSTIGPVLVALEFFAVVIGVTIVPIVVALAFNRRFRRRNPEKRPSRRGYYFAILSFIGGIALGCILETGVTAVIACSVGGVGRRTL